MSPDRGELEEEEEDSEEPDDDGLHGHALDLRVLVADLVVRKKREENVEK